MLTYPYPVLKAIETPWGEMKEQVHYMKVNGLSNKWEESHAYGGLWAENITQAVARDVLAHAMTLLTAKGHAIVLTIHDEIVAEGVYSEQDKIEFLTDMSAVPPWATGLPVATEGWVGSRYRK